MTEKETDEILSTYIGTAADKYNELYKKTWEMVDEYNKFNKPLLIEDVFKAFDYLMQFFLIVLIENKVTSLHIYFIERVCKFGNVIDLITEQNRFPPALSKLGFDALKKLDEYGFMLFKIILRDSIMEYICDNFFVLAKLEVYNSELDFLSYMKECVQFIGFLMLCLSYGEHKGGLELKLPEELVDKLECAGEEYFAKLWNMAKEYFSE